jgi:hypothetical protein
MHKHRWLVYSHRVWYIVGSNPDQVRPKTIQLVFAASLLRAQLYLRSKSKDQLTHTLVNVFEWGDISTRGLLFQ